MGDLREGAAPRTQVEVLVCLSIMGTSSGAEGGGEVLPLPSFSKSSCERTMEELYELDVFLSVGELNKS